MLDLKNIIESLLFVSDEPLALDKLRGILETVETKEIRTALQALSDEYAARGGGFYLQEVAGGWQIRSRPEYNEWIKRLLQPSPQRLSRAALETLAVIAYKQPIIRVDIEHIRGVDCGGVLRQLMERKLVRVLGRREIAGRPLIYATTKLFLEMFDLKDLNDLPTPKEIAELGNAMVDSAQVNTGAQPTFAPVPAEQPDQEMAFSPETYEPGTYEFDESSDPQADSSTLGDVAEDILDPEDYTNTSITVDEEAITQALKEEIEPPAQASPPGPPEDGPLASNQAEDPKNA